MLLLMFSGDYSNTYHFLISPRFGAHPEHCSYMEYALGYLLHRQVPYTHTYSGVYRADLTSDPHRGTYLRRDIYLG